MNKLDSFWQYFNDYFSPSQVDVSYSARKQVEGMFCVVIICAITQNGGQVMYLGCKTLYFNK